MSSRATDVRRKRPDGVRSPILRLRPARIDNSAIETPKAIIPIYEVFKLCLSLGENLAKVFRHNNLVRLVHSLCPHIHENIKFGL
jgi:hypothetical protein